MKRALVLSGGGSKGGYQAGVLDVILGQKQLKYDIFCGVSVGALNTSYLAMFPEGQEKESAAGLLNIWKTIKTSDVRKNWFLFRELAALWKPSVYNSKPLQEYVNKTLDVERLRSSGKQLAVGAVSLKTGKYKMFGQLNKDIKKAVLASSSFPAFLCPVEIDDQLWTDGGVRDVTPVKAAIDMGATEIDIVMTSPAKDQPKFSDDPNTIDVAFKSIEILADEVMENDIKIANLYTTILNQRRINNKLEVKLDGKIPIKLRLLRPSEKLPGESLDFERKDLDKMIELGRKDALASGW